MESSSHIIDRILSHRFSLHFLFWMLISLIFYVFFSMFMYDSFVVYLINLIAILPSQILLTYFLTYFLIPKVLLKKKYLLFSVLFVISLYLSMVLARFLTIYVVEEINHRDFEKESIWEIVSQLQHLYLRYLLPVIVAPLIFIPIHLLKDRLEEKGKIEELEKEKINAQLKFLKTQIHPHFLFNTLNNLYLLTLDKRKEAPEVVLKLSEMLDYMLYQCNEPTVTLVKEIELINNYIELERLRYDETLELKFDHKLEDQNAKIAPLILLSLAENAFKHGGRNKLGKTKIEIEIRELKNILHMTVSNTKAIQAQALTKKGIGLVNMKTQLELQYPGKYSLKVDETESNYEVKLKIHLL